MKPYKDKLKMILSYTFLLPTNSSTTKCVHCTVGVCRAERTYRLVADPHDKKVNIGMLVLRIHLHHFTSGRHEVDKGLQRGCSLIYCSPFQDWQLKITSLGYDLSSTCADPYLIIKTTTEKGETKVEISLFALRDISG